ncbi:hypothetical protein [Flagellimonas sp. CMM7]|uniref:hypothetical protein n=1 Tax=Flagellimonas sp. CMM7 TaxID=2654676 RepID=UPI0013CF7A1D|nr:hypothetical protein [Flagellimonas sp. CMM7]UII79716.1 hypothetical protein LV704_18900 [Flagellimonas sp. CMM7]
MKTKNGHIWRSSLLTGILLFQLSFAIVHLLTSHIFHPISEVDFSNETISETEYNCSLCAKLNIKPATLPLVSEVVFTTLFFSSVFAFKNISISTVSADFKYLRGPPFKHLKSSSIWAFY